jgi:hypothetical protein
VCGYSEVRAHATLQTLHQNGGRAMEISSKRLEGVQAAKLLKTRRGERKLCHANPNVKHALGMWGFNSGLTLLDTEDAASRSFRPTGAA